MKSLLKATSIMFIFDLLILCFVTYICAELFGYTGKAILFLCILVVSVGLIVLFLKGNYKIREYNITVKNTYLLFEGVVMMHILPAIYLLIFAASITSSLQFLAVNILAIFIFLRLYRALYHLYLFYVKKEKNILILGTDERARTIADEIQSKKALRMNVVGFVQEDSHEEEIVEDNKFPIYKSEGNLKQLIKEKKVDTVVIAQATEQIISIPRGIEIYKMPEFYEIVTGKYYIDEKTITELYYQYATHRSVVYDFCKRAYDIIAATIILVVTSPITVFTALRIWMTDHENPIYTQTRIGIGGRPFKCFKLRTMWANDYVPKAGKIKEETAGINDDRVIPFCRFVRKARFDEIPQMINVLKGEMSIVGPRAEWDDLVKIYSKEIPYYTSRQWVKTGWTGWAQINQGHCVNNDDVTEKLQYDLYYLKNRTLVWEIFILVKAVFLALGGRHE
ncbi:MAG: exopolysaccharide biosynthesis polyprenyl glycosylphosphotransferase [bacterium]|nr:exopolysaccharide biosynthesis polyprenyl glycosylphosphotransferase [bacterium]